MNKLIAKRLDNRKENIFFDPELSKKIGTVARQYIDCGLAALNYAIPDYDAATDLVEMNAPVLDAKAFAAADRNSPINFRHPMTFTEMTTLTTFVSQILFGGEQARSVQAQGNDDEPKAEAINGLLSWNDSKLNIYWQGYLWTWDAVVYNRGVWFESTAQDVRIETEEVEEDDITAEQIPLTNKDGTPKIRKGVQVMGYPKIPRKRTKRVYTGFHNHIDLVSPYDFICDPELPLTRFQESRFAGHRVMIPWQELKRRSELEPTSDSYVLPEVVDRIKTRKGDTTTPAPLGGTPAINNSRAAYERTHRRVTASGMGGVGAGLVPGSDAVNKDDGGEVECFNLVVRAKPSALGLYPNDEEMELFSILLTNQADVLSINTRNNRHGEFPYAVGEARPNGHHQFSPGWALAIKPVQDRVDDLNITHSQAQKRMGNILIVDASKGDISNLLSPNKNGLMIMRTQEGKGAPVADIVSQIPLMDTTANYTTEIAQWITQAETTTGAHAYVQGQSENPSQTATQFEGTQDMATGRISSIARILSESAITDQTARFVSNFQQYMPDSQIIRVLGKGSEFDPDKPPAKFAEVKRADIQGNYDVVPHDGSLPGADSQVVGAATKAIEAWSANPLLSAAFDSTIPGSLDPVRIFRDLLEKSGLPIEKFTVTREQAVKNLQSKQLSQGMGIQPGMPPMPPTQPQIPQPVVQ